MPDGLLLLQGQGALYRGGTAGVDGVPGEPHEVWRQAGGFCQYCGQPLREIGRERFCNNVNCRNRYVSV